MSDTGRIDDGDDRGEHSDGDDGRRNWTAIVLGGLLVIAVVVIAVLLADDDDDDETAPPASSTTTSEAVPTTTTTEAPATTAPEPSAAGVIWPEAGSGTTFDDPVEAARSFAVDYVGFTDPVVGELAAGDSRSGEVEVRPSADGPVTTVLVRQVGSGTAWSVIGASTADIVLESPAAGDAIASPVTVSGEALAFEGNVAVEVREAGRREPIGTGNVTGGGDVARPFEGDIEFTTPSASDGALVLVTHSARDGAVERATVIPVTFG